MASASEEKTTAERYQEYEEVVNIVLLGKVGSGKYAFLDGLETFISPPGTFKLNEKIRFSIPDLPASVRNYETYDLFLFFTTSSKLDKDELKVLEIIKSIDKKVFVVFSKMEKKAKIGDVYEKKGLRSSILKSVRTRIPEFWEEDTRKPESKEKDTQKPEFKDIFLVSNKYPNITEWDFEPLIRSILDVLPLCIVRRLTPLAAPLLDCDDVDKYAKRKPLHELCNLFKKNIPAWSDAKVNIAIVGDAGTGKSSYINAIRGLDDDAEEAAKVGYFCGDTTKVPKHFSYPDNPNIRLWDIQGFGSTITKNDVNNYAKDTGLKSYDCFLIFFNTRLSENAVQLAQKLQELKKPFFFVLTKADNIKIKKGYDKQAMLKETREVLLKQLEDKGLAGFISSQQLFLISNEEEHRNDYDFEKLTQAILDVLPESKRGTLTLSLQACYQAILKKKFEILRGNVKWAAAKAAVYCAVPLPDALLGLVFNVDVVKKQAEEYRFQFGLDKEGKKYLDEYITGTKARVESKEAAAELSGALDLTGFWGGLSATVAAIWHGAKLTTKVASGAATIVLPMAAAGCEGWSAKSTLHHCLDNLEKEAEEYLKKIVEKATSKLVKNE